MGRRKSNLLRQFLFQSPQRIAYFQIRRRWLRARDKKNLEQHIAEIIWYRAKTKSAPKLEIKKNPGVEKGRYPILEFQMQNGEQLGTNPPSSLAKKKRKKVRLQKKLPKAKPISAKKKLLSLNKATSSTSQTHTKRYPATRFQIEKWSIKNSNSSMIAETKKKD